MGRDDLPDRWPEAGAGKRRRPFGRGRESSSTKTNVHSQRIFLAQAARSRGVLGAWSLLE